MAKKKPIPVDPPAVSERFEIIADLFPDADADGFDGVVVRSVPTEYANKNDFFSGEGAAKSGGRWNRPGISVIYASLDVITATHEAYQNIDSFGFPMTAIQPRVMAGGKASFGKVLDLTDPKVRSQIGFSLKELVDEDWESIQASGKESWTQAIGRGCLVAGFEAILVPSARNNKGKNIVIFTANLTGKEISILAPDKLPK